MATTVDTLLIEIQAETRKLRKGLDNVNKKLDTTKKKTKDANGALKALGGVLAGLGAGAFVAGTVNTCLLYTSPSPRDLSTSRMPSSA